MNISLADDQQRLYVAKVSLVTGVLVMCCKFIAFQITGSTAVLSDALESIVNVISAAVVLLTMGLAVKPADKDHPYGHGKIEFFSSVFEGGLVAFAALFICVEAISALINGHALERISEGLILVALAGVVNFWLGYYLIRKGRKLHSISLESSGQHVLSDVWTSLGLILGLVCVKLTGWVWVDALLALGVGLYLTYAGIKIVRKSIAGLMDEEDPEIIKHVAKIMHANMNQGIIDVHDMKIMRAGRIHHLDMHIILPEFWTVSQAHERLKIFEKNVFQAYQFDGQMHFHYDPCLQNYCRICDLDQCPVRQEAFNKEKAQAARVYQSQSEATVDIENARALEHLGH